MRKKGAYLICNGSSSAGNQYVLTVDNEILLLEAGLKHCIVCKSTNFQNERIVGCILSHGHGDHSRYAEEYANYGVHIYCNDDVRGRKRFPFGSYTVMEAAKTISIGSFRVSALPLHHDIPNFGYVIYHPFCGTIFFALDTYKFDFFLQGVDHWLIEANYDDRILKANVEDGKIDRHQANRLMLSHMSIDNTIHFLHECHAEKSKNIILCHLSERNSDPDMFRSRVAGEFGISTYIADKNVVVELNKEPI